MLARNLASLLIAAAALALSGLAPTTASAVVFTLTNVACSGGTTIAYCYQGTDPAGKVGTWELEGEQTIVGLTGTAKIVIPSLETLTIECNQTNSGGTPVILQHSPLGNGLTTIEGGNLLFLGCRPTTPTSIVEKCELNSALETANLLDELEGQTDVVVTPESGTTFIELEYKNKSTLKCPNSFIGKKKISGFQLLTIVNPNTPEETEKAEIEATSGLFFGEETPVEIISPEIEFEFPGLAPDLIIISTLS